MLFHCVLRFFTGISHSWAFSAKTCFKRDFVAQYNKCNRYIFKHYAQMHVTALAHSRFIKLFKPFGFIVGILSLSLPSSKFGHGLFNLCVGQSFQFKISLSRIFNIQDVAAATAAAALRTCSPIPLLGFSCSQVFRYLGG